MFDQFLEQIVVRRRGQGILTAGYYLCFAFCILSALLAFIALQSLFMSFSVGGLIYVLLLAALAFFLFRNKDNLRVEYEYSFTSGEMDFAKVLSNSRRKHLISLSLKNVESGGWVDSDAFRRLEGNKEIKKHYLVLNADAKEYFLYYIKEGQKTLIIFEPNDALVKLMHDYRPQILAGNA